jgi:hypothetical protein
MEALLLSFLTSALDTGSAQLHTPTALSPESLINAWNRRRNAEEYNRLSPPSIELYFPCRPRTAKKSQLFGSFYKYKLASISVHSGWAAGRGELAKFVCIVKKN